MKKNGKLNHSTWAALAVAIGTTAPIVLVGHAHAQDDDGAFRRDRNTSVRERPKPEYAPLGLRAGGFLFYPELAASYEYSDNVFATDTAQQEDSAVHLEGAARLQSDWNSHELNFFADADSRVAGEFDELDRTNWRVGSSGRLDIVRGSYLYANTSYSEQHEEIWDTGSSLLLAEPVPYSRTDVTAGWRKTFNRLRLTAESGFHALDYDNTPLQGGGVAQEDTRDHILATLSLRGDYAISPATALFVSAEINHRDYDIDPPDPRALVTRDSDGYDVLVGANFDITRLVRGEIGVGFLTQAFDDPSASDVSDLAVSSRVEWFPDELVTVTLALNRSIRDADVATAAGYISTDASVRADYEFRRNIVLTAAIGYSNDDYQGVTREYDRRWVELGGDYLLNRNSSLFFEISHFEQTSNDPLGREYDLTRGLIGTRVRW